MKACAAAAAASRKAITSRRSREEAGRLETERSIWKEKKREREKREEGG